MMNNLVLTVVILYSVMRNQILQEEIQAGIPAGIPAEIQVEIRVLEETAQVIGSTIHFTATGMAVMERE